VQAEGRQIWRPGLGRLSQKILRLLRVMMSYVDAFCASAMLLHVSFWLTVYLRSQRRVGIVGLPDMVDDEVAFDPDAAVVVGLVLGANNVGCVVLVYV
jgi:hypothetical protein